MGRVVLCQYPSRALQDYRLTSWKICSQSDGQLCKKSGYSAGGRMVRTPEIAWREKEAQLRGASGPSSLRGRTVSEAVTDPPGQMSHQLKSQWMPHGEELLSQALTEFLINKTVRYNTKFVVLIH